MNPWGTGWLSPGMAERGMSIDRVVLIFAGAMILLSLVLAVTVSTKFLLLTGFVGANLLQSAFTGFCPLASILKRVGVQPGEAFR